MAAHNLKMMDLFSGIGGFSLAARWTGRIETIGFCETDPYCCKVLKKNFPGVPIHGDIRTLKGAGVGSADIISGGFPCQPFSVAGKRCGTEDDRYLWPEMLRVVSDVRPSWIVGENVDGLVRMGVQFGVPEVASRKHQRTEEFDYLRRVFTRQETVLLFSILEDLEALGYGAVPLVVPACGVDAPHLRYRVWIVAHADGTGWDARESAAEAVGYRSTVAAKGGDVSNPAILHDDRTGYGAGAVLGQRGESSELSGCQNVAHAEIGAIGAGLRQDETGGIGRGRSGDGGSEDVPDANRPGRREQRGTVAGTTEQPTPEQPCRWLPEPDVGRVAHGVPARVDRLRALGNAIVPQVAYEILMAILRAENHEIQHDKEER